MTLPFLIFGILLFCAELLIARIALKLTMSALSEPLLQGK